MRAGNIPQAFAILNPPACHAPGAEPSEDPRGLYLKGTGEIS